MTEPPWCSGHITLYGSPWNDTSAPVCDRSPVLVCCHAVEWPYSPDLPRGNIRGGVGHSSVGSLRPAFQRETAPSHWSSIATVCMGNRRKDGITWSSQPQLRAQERWKEERQKRLRQPSVAPFSPHSRHLILRPRRTASGTSCGRSHHSCLAGDSRASRLDQSKQAAAAEACSSSECAVQCCCCSCCCLVISLPCLRLSCSEI